VTLEDLPDRVLEQQSAMNTPAGIAASMGPAMTASDVSLEELEKQHIQHVLATATTLEEAASILGINLSTLWRKRRRYGLD
ncbi:MAG: helix-turn-helix domain-containing protein, partial [Bdellovibrionota bacterium]